ncbi:MAG: FGGY-family carbohydrate kinase [Opitutales bacterium]|nr:FGGY-family carbohydrate kinase [Opitutales bacterium]
MFTLGLDYGTNSVRALVVRCADGAEFGSCVVPYPHGREGVLLDPRDHQLARQHPGDYLFGLKKSVRGALAAARKKRGFTAAQVIGIGVDTTGSSPLPVDRHNRALAADPRWAKNLHAQCWLWKDHTSYREAAEITALAAKIRPHFIAKCGNTYSSEWFWSKLLHCRRTAPAVFRAAWSWVELADWIPSVLAGVTAPEQVVRGICCAGHKALYSDDWGGLPDPEFLAQLDPALADLRDRLYAKAHDATQSAGRLCPEWAAQLGLPAGLPLAIGEMDVHYGAIGCGVAEGTLVKVIGTSLTQEAARQKPGQSGLLALDWNNGNRTILVDPLLTGLIVGCTLHTTQAEIYRALIEATAFGARAIIERFRAYGVPIHRVVCAGGIAEKNPLLMQIYADVTGCTMLVSGSSQACALGAALSAAVLAGAHPDFPTAQRRMTSLKKISYRPRPAAQRTYDQLYALYRQVHDAFGGLNRSADLSRVMKDLLALKAR